MRRLVATFNLLVILAASAANLRAQWPNNPAGGGSTAGIAFRPLPTMVTVTWQALSPGATYHLYRAPDSTSRGADLSGVITALTFTDKSAQAGTLYFYHIEAHATGAQKPAVSAPQRFTLMKPVAVELPAKKKP
jgi:hypothetical protein